MISDEQLDKQGDYFVKYRVQIYLKITFEQFVEKWRQGAWDI